jgi:2-polyprenyl-3-methyl-5-hydroxy-6-metoxy-1,4-benzoquinol methylase
MSAETGQSRVEANPGLEQLKQRMRDTWMAGDFGQIAGHTAKGAEEFVARLPISPGMRVLDVACGTVIWRYQRRGGAGRFLRHGS